MRATAFFLLVSLLCAVPCACESRAASSPAPADGRERSGGNPLGEHALRPRERFGFDGRVEERLPAGGYLYLRVRDQHGADHWVATLAALAPESPRVHVWVMAHADRFRSRRLSRDFTPLLFASVRAAR